MRRFWLLAAVLLTCCAVLASGTAVAQTVSFSDPAGDGLKGTHLDMTSIDVANRDHVIVITISFVKVSHGDLLLSIKQRGQAPSRQAGVTSSHRARGDKNRLYGSTGVEKCKGFKVTWEAALSRVRVRVPSRCLTHGDYGAIKTQAATSVGGFTADAAPKTPKGKWGWTDWVSRG